MQSTISPLLFATLVLTLACGSPAPTTPDSNGPYATVTLELNNGKKWQITPEMSGHMQQALAAIDAASATGQPDFHQLASDLIEFKNHFVESCNMEGESHEALHNWLVPYLGLLDELHDADTPETQRKAFAHIQEARTLFDQHFQL